MISCPHCSLANPDGAQRCDCGWDFSSSRMKASYLPANDPSIKRKTPWWTMYLQEIVVIPIALAVWLVQHPSWLLAALTVALAMLAFFLRRRAIRLR